MLEIWLSALHMAIPTVRLYVGLESVWAIQLRMIGKAALKGVRKGRVIQFMASLSYAASRYSLRLHHEKETQEPTAQIGGRRGNNESDDSEDERSDDVPRTLSSAIRMERIEQQDDHAKGPDGTGDQQCGGLLEAECADDGRKILIEARSVRQQDRQMQATS